MSDIETILETAQNSRRYLKLAEKHARQSAEQMRTQIEEIEQRVSGMRFTQKEAAAFAGCDVTTVHRHRKEGKLKSLIITDVRDWKRQHKPGWGD